MTTFADRLRGRRKALGLTLDALAAKTGLSKTFLSEMENNKARPGADTLLTLAKTFGVSCDWLMKGGDDRPAGGPLLVPPGLAELAEAEKLPFRSVTLLIALRQTIAVHRRERPDAAFDWAKLYHAIREWL